MRRFEITLMLAVCACVSGLNRSAEAVVTNKEYGIILDSNYVQRLPARRLTFTNTVFEGNMEINVDITTTQAAFNLPTNTHIGGNEICTNHGVGTLDTVTTSGNTTSNSIEISNATVFTYGSELTTNGTFDSSDGWDVSGDAIFYAGSVGVGVEVPPLTPVAGSLWTTNAELVISTGKTYRLDIAMNSDDAFTITASLGGVTNVLSPSDTYSVFTNTLTTATPVFSFASDENGGALSVQTVSIKEQFSASTTNTFKVDGVPVLTTAFPRSGIWGMALNGELSLLSVVHEAAAGFWKLNTSGEIVLSGNNWPDAFFELEGGEIKMKDLP